MILTHKTKGNNNKKLFLCSEFFTADETQLLHVHPSFLHFRGLLGVLPWMRRNILYSLKKKSIKKKKEIMFY